MTIKNTIETYRKRRNQLTPLLIGIVAILLVVVGIVIVVTSLGGKAGSWNPFASKTPTPTITYTATDTPTQTDTPTITPTPTITGTATPSAPWEYVVKQGETLTTIIKDNNLGDNALINILILNPGLNPDLIKAGQKIILPPPNYPIVTPTPIPTGLAAGTRIKYLVMPNDSLGGIAAKFNTTVDAIVKLTDNKAVLPNGVSSVIHPGQVLTIPVNLVAHSATPSATRTSPPPQATATATK
jgi:LysM repeat protein